MAQKLSSQLSGQRVSRTQRKVFVQEQRSQFESQKQRAEGFRKELSNATSIQEYEERYNRLPSDVKSFFLSPSDVKTQKELEEVSTDKKAEDTVTKWRAEQSAINRRIQTERDFDTRQQLQEQARELHYRVQALEKARKQQSGASFESLEKFAKDSATTQLGAHQQRGIQIEANKKLISEGKLPVYNQYGNITRFLEKDGDLPDYLKAKQSKTGRLSETNVSRYESVYGTFERGGKDDKSFELLPEKQKRVLVPDYDKLIAEQEKKTEVKYVPLYETKVLGDKPLFSPSLTENLKERGILKDIPDTKGEYLLEGDSIKRIQTFGGAVTVRGKDLGATTVDPSRLLAFSNQKLEQRNKDIEKQLKQIEQQNIANDIILNFSNTGSVALSREAMAGDEELFMTTEKTPKGDFIKTLESGKTSESGKITGLAGRDLSELSFYKKLDISIGNIPFVRGGSLLGGVSVEEADSILDKVQRASNTNPLLQKELTQSKSKMVGTGAIGSVGALAVAVPSAVVAGGTLFTLTGISTALALIGVGISGAKISERSMEKGSYEVLTEQQKEIEYKYSKEMEIASTTRGEAVATYGYRFSDPDFVKNYFKSTASRENTRDATFLQRLNIFKPVGERIGSKQERLHEIDISTSLKEQGVPEADLPTAVAITQSKRVNKAINTIEKLVFFDILSEAYGRVTYGVTKAGLNAKRNANLLKLKNAGYGKETIEFARRVSSVQATKKLTETAIKSVAIGGFAEGSLASVEHIKQQEGGFFKGGVFTVGTGINVLKTAGFGFGASVFAVSLGKPIIDSQMAGKKFTSDILSNVGYGVDFPSEFLGDKAIDIAEKLFKVRVPIRPRVITPSFTSTFTRTTQQSKTTQQTKTTSLQKTMNQIDTRRRKLMARISSSIVPSSPISSSGKVSIASTIPSDISFTSTIPTNVPVSTPSTITTLTEVIIPSNIITTTPSIIPSFIPTTVPTTTIIPTQTTQTDVTVPTFTPKFKLPPIPFWGGGGKKRGKRKKTKRKFGALPDFTSRILGLEREQAKNINDLIKKVTKLQTGLEIRRGVKL